MSAGSKVPTQAHQEVVVWLVRTLLAAVLAGLVWSLRTLVHPMSDEAEFERLLAESGTVFQESQAAEDVRGARGRLFANAQARADSITGGDGFPGVARLLGQSAMDSRASAQLAGRLRTLPFDAAEDSADASGLRGLSLTRSAEELLHAIEVAYGRERRLWELLGRTLAPQSRASRRARNDSVAGALDDWFVAEGGALALEGHARVTDSLRFAHGRESVEQMRTRLQASDRVGVVALLTSVVCSLVLWWLAGYALTGDPRHLRFLRRRADSTPPPAGTS